MGSSAENKSIARATAARRAANRRSPSPETSDGSGGQSDSRDGNGGSGGGERRPLSVHLVRIAADVHSRSRPGEAVRVEEHGINLTVLTSNGRIGDIPPGHVRRVRDRQFLSGTISELRTNPAGVTVSLI